MQENPYIPFPVKITDIITENRSGDLKTFTLEFTNTEDAQAFTYLPGQFAELSVLGLGESPFGIASSPTEEGFVQFTVKRVGSVTIDLHQSDPGRVIGIRGPLGKSFPWNRMEGKNILIVGGGFAFTTLRSAIVYMLHHSNRSRFNDITILYGAREPGEVMYQTLLDTWREEPTLNLTLTVDNVPEGAQWGGEVGLIPGVLKDVVAPAAENTIALVCGPPVMIRFTIPVLMELGFSSDDIILSLENRMKCGIGKCGRCNIGPKYVCVDGPVFDAKAIFRS
jgi:NAD(P)H-flavin reductase